MTDEQPEQWAVDIAASLGLYSDVSVRTIVRAFANRHGDLVAAKVSFAEREADLVGALEWIAIVCAEEIDLEYNDGMRKAFQRSIGSVANKALKSREASHG